MDEDVRDLIARRVALLDQWVHLQRRIAVLQARCMDLLARRWEVNAAEIADAPTHRDAIERSMVAEYAAAGRVAKGTMEFAFADARLLGEGFELVRESFSAGRITAAHVREILRESQPVRDAVRAGAVIAGTLDVYQAAAVEIAESDTATRTRVAARRIAAALAGSTVVEQHERARAERSVSVRSVGDGLALLQAVLPEHLAVGIMDRLTAMARHMKTHPEDREPCFSFEEPGDMDVDDDGVAIFGSSTFTSDPFDCDADPDELAEQPLPSDPLVDDDSPCIIHLPADERTVDQLRADLFTDLLLAGSPSPAHGTGLDGIHATIQVTVAATTLAGVDDRPGELDGHGPLHPDIARALAGARTGWTRLFLNGAGFVTETDSYTPTEPMRRYLRARDQHCRFPGCRMPVHRCEIDHNLDWARGGPTRIDNLAHFCTAHHPLKHPDIPDTHRWSAHQQPDQTVVWTSPNGRTYSDHAPRRVMFVPSDAGADGVAGAGRAAPPGAPPGDWNSEPRSAAQAGSPF